MDADKTVKIASRRFKNGNYLLEQNMLAASRKEFDVAYVLYSKLDMQKETAEALNNIGITLVREGMLVEAKKSFERSYELKKRYISSPSESLFNTLHNLLGVCEKLDKEAYMKYYEEHKAAGEALGGEFLATVEKEKAVYEKVAARHTEMDGMAEEEPIEDGTPAEILEQLKNAGKPCMAYAAFAIRGIALEAPRAFSFVDNGRLVKVNSLLPAYYGEESFVCQFTKGDIEFESSFEDMSRVIWGGKAIVEGNIITYVKKLFSALASVRDDAAISINDGNFIVTAVGFKSASDRYIEAYRRENDAGPAPVTLSGEDCMMADLALSSAHYSAFKLYLANSGKMLGDGNHSMAIAVAMAGFEQFIGMFLRRTLSEDMLGQYRSEPRTLEEKIEWVKGIACYGCDDTLSALEEVNAGAAIYRSVVDDGKDAGEDETRLVLKAVSRAIYALKSMYGI